jgi:sigma-B regulation protein RsbU (phosphoserine phosphatase)
MCIPATSVSGDYYDYLVDASGRLVLIVADVAGHSISSALVMAGARAIVRRETARASGPAELLALTNRTMYEDLVSAELFITAFCACYQPETRRLCFAGAGHNPPLLRRADGTVEALEPDGAAIGLLEEAEYEEQSLVLEPGDLVLLYTDGAVEAAGARQRQFGQERLHSVLAGWTGGSARDLVEEVLLEIRAHTGEQPQRDDITMLAMRVV